MRMLSALRCFMPEGHSKCPHGFKHSCMFTFVLNWFFWIFFVFSDFCRGFCSVWCVCCCALTFYIKCCDKSCGFETYGQCTLLLCGYKTAALIEENRFILNLFVLTFLSVMQWCSQISNICSQGVHVRPFSGSFLSHVFSAAVTGTFVSDTPTSSWFCLTLTVLFPHRFVLALWGCPD